MGTRGESCGYLGDTDIQMLDTAQGSDCGWAKVRVPSISPNGSTIKPFLHRNDYTYSLLSRNGIYVSFSPSYDLYCSDSSCGDEESPEMILVVLEIGGGWIDGFGYGASRGR